MTGRQDLTTSQAAAIKWRLACGESDEQIAAVYGVSVKTIRRIANGYIYVHVKALEPKGERG